MQLDKQTEKQAEKLVAPNTAAPKENWLSQAASDAWSAGAGAARVAGNFGLGMVKQAYEHPMLTLSEGAAGAAVTYAAVETGLGALAIGAIAAAPAAGYLAYKGIDIAATEGVGAIPTHLKEFADETSKAFTQAKQVVGAVYDGTADSATLAAAAKQIQQVGRDTVPLAAGALGGLTLGVVADETVVAAEARNFFDNLPVDRPYLGDVSFGVQGQTTVGSEIAGATVAAGYEKYKAAATGGDNSSTKQTLPSLSEKPLDYQGKLLQTPH